MYNDIDISIILPSKASNLLANVAITLDTYSCGKITIKGFQIWKSKNYNDRLQERINVAPPTKRYFSRYIPQVFIEDKPKWYELEERIYEAYKVKMGSKREEVVNPEEIHI